MESPAYTETDRALLMAIDTYEASLCGGCGQPLEHAWHSGTEGWWETTSYVCWACTARTGDEVAHPVTRFTMPPDHPLDPFELGVTTYSPDAA